MIIINIFYKINTIFVTIEDAWSRRGMRAVSENKKKSHRHTEQRKRQLRKLKKICYYNNIISIIHTHIIYICTYMFDNNNGNNHYRMIMIKLFTC